MVGSSMGNERERILLSVRDAVPMNRPPVRSHDDDYFLKYHIAIWQIMLPVMRKLFMVLRPNNEKTNKELLFDIDGYSMKKYKRVFHVNERKKLDNNASIETFDVVIMFKLLHLTCGLDDFSEASWDKPGTLENTLLRMKNHRNILCRENIEVPFNVMEARFKDVEELCHRVLIIIGLRSKQRMTADITEMRNYISYTLYGDVD